MSTAQFSNYYSPDYEPDSIRSATKGKNSVYAMAVASNEPRNQEGIAGKVSGIVFDSYLRRPSLRDEALMKMTEFAHNAVCAVQTPNYPVECSLAVLMTQGNHFRWLCAGDVRIFHLVNGQIVNSNKGVSPGLGGHESRDQPPESLEEQTFGKDENSFLLCSGSFTRYVSKNEIEETLAASETADDWMQALKNLYEDRCNGEPFSIMTVFIPLPKKRPAKAFVIAAVAVLLIAALFFGLGAFRRKNMRPEPSQAGPGQPGISDTQPGQPEQTGQPGETGQPTQPAPPSQPPSQPTPPPEPTEPPEPSAPMPGFGQPGIKPSKPPKPTPPPEPTPPSAPTEPTEPGSAQDANFSQT